MPTRTLDPPRKDEIALLLDQGYSPEQIKVFYVLRQIPQLGISKQDLTIEKFVETELAETSLEPALNGPPRTLPEFEASVSRLFPKLKNWREVPHVWFDPAPPKPQTYLNVISRRLNEFHDRHMVKVLVNELNRGRWVFAVADASHVVMQEPALRAAFEVR